MLFFFWLRQGGKRSLHSECGTPKKINIVVFIKTSLFSNNKVTCRKSKTLSPKKRPWIKKRKNTAYELKEKNKKKSLIILHIQLRALPIPILISTKRKEWWHEKTWVPHRIQETKLGKKEKVKIDEIIIYQLSWCNIIDESTMTFNQNKNNK